MHKQQAGPTAAAPAQAAGYLFQLRYALYRALKRLLRDPTASIGIERIDDVSIESGSVEGIEQLKHTSSDKAQLTDSSVSIWRTIGNWSRLVEKNDLNLAALELVLVTNSSIIDGSALSKLAVADADRDPSAALILLKAVATASTNQNTKSDRNFFLALDETVQIALVRAIRVASDSPSLAALGDEIEDIVHYACEPSQLPDFRAELEGWWFDRVSSALSGGQGALVPLIELDARVGYLREKYKISSLQIDVDDPAELPEHLDDYLFVKQVKILEVGNQRVRNIQRDFLKASAQRSKWLRHSRIDPAELNRYDMVLQTTWATQFSIVTDELPAEATDADKRRCGRQLLGWAETQQTPLRGAAAQFLTSGSYHTLADQVRLGWHPDFQKLFGAP